MIYWLSLLLMSAWGLEGQFVFQGDFQGVSSHRKETIFPQSPAGQKRWEELRNQGHDCVPKLQFVQCTISTAPETPKNFTPKVVDVTFGSLVSLTPLYSGEDMIQYEADQTVVVNGNTYPRATYYEFKNFVKIAVGSPDSSNYYSFIVGKDTLGFMEQVHITESKWVYSTHWIESTLVKK